MNKPVSQKSLDELKVDLKLHHDELARCEDPFRRTVLEGLIKHIEELIQARVQASAGVPNEHSPKPELILAAVPRNVEQFVDTAVKMWRKLKGTEPTEESIAVFRAMAEKRFGTGTK